MSRLPIRVRLTLGFAVAMAAVLGVVGAVVYERTGASILEEAENGLEARAETLQAVYLARGGDLSGVLVSSDDEGFAQLIGAGGDVGAASEGVRGAALLTASELERGRRGAFFVSRDELDAVGGAPARLLVGPTGDGGVLVVGVSLEDREEALRGLAAQLFVVGPVALLVVAAAGYALTGAALRPVEAMRAEASLVAGGAPGRRLPLPAAWDEVRRLGETLNAMIARLEASVARERRFVADASHELRTPLATLRTELELAERRPRSNAELLEALRSAAAEVDHLSRLAEDLLVLARLGEDSGVPIVRSRVVVPEVVERVRRRFADRAAAEGRRIETDAAGATTVDGDAIRLEQAVGNLVDNALRHGAGTVRVEVKGDGEAVEVRVIDEGGGFASEFVPEAFERFTRGDAARTGGGAGLGLAIVQAIASAHGGEARIEERTGGGGCVVVRLPRAVG